MKNSYFMIGALKLIFKHYLVLFMLISTIGLYADGYKLTLSFEGINDSVCYLANYYGDKTYLTDTAYLDKSGNYIFEGDSILPGGIYILAGQSNNKYLELIIDKEQHFKIEASTKGMPESVNFIRSNDNTLFYNYINFSIKIRKQIEELSKRKSILGNDHDSVSLISTEINILNQNIKKYENDLIKNNSDSFVSVLLKAMQEPEIEKPRLLPDGKEDSVYAYQSFKQHYWDNLNPADERLLRTPLYHKRLENYFNKVIYQHPDTLIREADLFIQRAGTNKETYKYSIWYLTYKFETSNIMGFDEIFVHMVDDYYAKGKAYWADSSVVKTLMERANELRLVLIGSPAQDLILLDTAGSFKSLYGINASYTVIFFYEIGCSHCKKEIKELKNWYPDNKFNAEIFAVCTDTALAEWKKFLIDSKLEWINVNGTRSITPDYHHLYDIKVTPTIYLLDDKKKILAKRLKSDQLFSFIENYEKLNKSAQKE